MFSLLTVVALLPALARAYQQVQINPNGDTSQCLTVVGTPANGALIRTQACVQGNAKQMWDIEPGNNPSTFTLHGTGFCVDAGENPHDLVRAKIWTCYAGLPQQTWYYTDDQRIAITGGSQCLDSGGSSGKTETYTCTDYNTNQIWTIPYTCDTLGEACPATPDPCCAWICAEAQVPFNVCSQTNTTSEYSICAPCQGPGTEP